MKRGVGSGGRWSRGRRRRRSRGRKVFSKLKSKSDESDGRWAGGMLISGVTHLCPKSPA